jgi:hypothetical protein
MFVTRYLSVGAGIGALGAAALLSAQHDSLVANPLVANPIVTQTRDVQPVAFSYTDVFPFIVGSPAAGAGSASALGVAAVADSAAIAAAGVLQSANTLGPIALTVNSLRSIGVNPATGGSPLTTTNYTQMDQWVGGIAGLMTSKGALGFTDNTEHYDPLGINHAGVLQLSNTLGPAFFDLNVLKAIGFFQGPGGTVLPTGTPDNISAVDIGRWNAGIPGLITNSGTTGFVTIQNTGDGSLSDYRVGGLHTTTQIGAMTFDFNFLPYISTGIIPPAFSFGLSPDMTAANTMFASITPPPPGVIQPNGGLPVPPIAAAATPTVAPLAAPAPAPISATPVSAAAVSAADPAPAPADPAPATTSTSNLPSVKLADEPKATIPGVNGAPLDKTTKTGTTGTGGGSAFDPWKAAKPLTDAVQSIQAGLGALGGNKPATGGAGESSSGGTSGGSAGGGSGSGGGGGE